MNNLAELRDSLEPERVKEILLQYEVEPVSENSKAIIFPTACHNLSGGSPKLYYYKDSKLFHCYTECNESFDIFDLLIKMNRLRGKDITLFEAIKICGLQNEIQNGLIYNESLMQDISYLYDLLETKTYYNDLLKKIDPEVLNRFVFNEKVLQLWNNEGISFETMRKYKIMYDSIYNCIIIPICDANGDIVSIRGRFLGADAECKYKPITYAGQILNCPSSNVLYGIQHTKEAISRKKTVIIFEGEKSVLKMDTYYGKNNNSIATLGQNISMYQIRELLKLNVNEVVIAYDADYYDYESRKTVTEAYKQVAEKLKPFFNTSILIDYNNLLGYKDSPIDCGKETFETLLENRIYI